MASRRFKVVGMVSGFAIVACASYVVLFRTAGPQMYEAYTTVTDVRLLTKGAAEVPERNAARHVANLIQIGKSRAVLERAKETLGTLNVANAEKTLSTLEIKPVENSDIISIRVTSADETTAKAVADVLAQHLRSRVQELEGLSKPVMQVVDPSKTAPANTMKVQSTLFLYGFPVLLVSIGIAIGYSMGRRTARKPRAIQEEMNGERPMVNG